MPPKKRKKNNYNFLFKNSGILGLSVTLTGLLFSFHVRKMAYQLINYNESVLLFFKKSYRFDLILLGAVFFLLKTFMEDPGVIPRMKWKNSLLYKKDTTISHRFKKIRMNSHYIHLKFCVTCGIWRAPRASHCTPCNSCIMRFDHHCPWIGTCVGLRNYRSFLIFTTLLFWYLSILIYDVVGSIFTKKKKGFNNNNEGFTREKTFIYPFILVVFGLIITTGFVFTGALFCFHFYLGVTGKTTSELFKFPNKKMGYRNPQQEIFSRVCKAPPPSLVKISFNYTHPSFFLKKII
mmetsp:Transcript_50945/g.103577  ORF Transcript_50945/g.103577 Transcript_50945/m.103577 type:complete len:292 (+) Transcript_50945:588-1463(+)